MVGKHEHFPVDIPRGPSTGLYERCLGTKKSLFIGIKDCNKRNLGQIKPFSKQIDTYKDIKFAEPQIPHDCDTFERVDIRVEILCLDTMVQEKIRQVLGKTFGQRRYEDTFFLLYRFSDIEKKYVDLVRSPLYNDLRIHKTCGSYDLFHDNPSRLFKFLFGRSSRDIKGLFFPGFKLFKCKRPVIERRRQPKTKFNERGLPGTITAVHADELRYCYVAFINHNNSVLRQIVHKRRRRFTGFSSGKVTGIVLNARAITHFSEHFKIIVSPHLYALGFEQLVL